ncbi:hypothetical protein ABZS76_31790 [Streptomyces sp. NPDC005562]|uniref:hypothetical protein n=1 Tax=Streptomyces sp. NPDC005562 TaxID=3154890 RepID=UPI0033A1FC65
MVRRAGVGRAGAGGRVRAPADDPPRRPRGHRLRTYYEAAGYAVVGELADKVAADGTSYGVLLLEKPLG